MAQFITHIDDLVLGEPILAFLNAMKRGYEHRHELLMKYFGEIPKPDKWYNLQTYLNLLRELAETVGYMNLFLAGVAIVENSPRPPMQNLNTCLSKLNEMYYMHHKMSSGTSVAYWTLLEFDELAHKAIMLSQTSYPSQMEEGLLTGFVRKFNPAPSTTTATITVKVDITKERRTEGGNSCTYLISW